MKCTLLELNEFNETLLKKASVDFGLLNIQKILRLNRTETFTEDQYESDFLEPWVQWVSVHTGQPSSVHQIKHLGDVPHLDNPQLWEILSEKGISSGVWGAMNAGRAGAKNNLFFLPDPWTASERAYPEELNQLLNPLRFASKNYLGNIAKKVLQQTRGLIQLIRFYRLTGTVLKQIPSLIGQLIRFKGAHFVFIAFAEYLSTLLFIAFKKRHKPDFSLLFINTLAHIQHHYWNDFDYQNNQKLKLGLCYLDKILEAIFKTLEPGEAFLVTNALSQKNTTEEKPWILYRPIDHAKLLAKAQIYPSKIEAHMTHDAHLYFDTPEACRQAEHLLKSAEIELQPLFLVETYTQEPTKLFYRLVFTDEVPKNSRFKIGFQELPFFEFYKGIVRRTGKHIPQGTLFSTFKNAPQKMQNHEIFELIVSSFASKDLELIQKVHYT